MSTILSILVTGSSSGFGRKLVESLARKEHTVFASMRGTEGKNQTAAEELRDLATSENLNLHVLELDVTQADSIKTAVQTVIDTTQRIDVLVNNAGIIGNGPTESFTTDQLRQIFEVNLFGVFEMNRAVLPHMRAQKSGLLVSVSSILGRINFPCSALYGASKHALECLAESMHYELSGFGVDSVIVQPGPYRTDLMGKFMSPEDITCAEEYGELAEFVLGGYGKLTQFMDENERANNPQEVADLIVKLIETPAGQRPLRTVIDPVDFGTEKINEVTAQVQAGVMEYFGFEKMLKVRR